MVARYADVTRSDFHAAAADLADAEAPRDLAPGLRRSTSRGTANASRSCPRVAARYLRTLENHVAAARLYRRGSSRPVVVILHGYMTGNFRFEQRVWPISWFDQSRARQLVSSRLTVPRSARRSAPARRA